MNDRASIRPRQRGDWRIAGALILGLNVLFIPSLPFAGSLLGSAPARQTDDAACATGTPSAIPATPATDPAGVGTPVASSCLTVTLLAETTQAAPNTLTVLIDDERGDPVEDATITIENRHLDMDHGTSTRPAEAVAPGRYVAEQVPMGMDGRWEVTVIVARPAQPPLAVVFLVRLEGPV